MGETKQNQSLVAGGVRGGVNAKGRGPERRMHRVKTWEVPPVLNVAETPPSIATQEPIVEAQTERAPECVGIEEIRIVKEVEINSFNVPMIPAPEGYHVHYGPW